MAHLPSPLEVASDLCNPNSMPKTWGSELELHVETWEALSAFAWDKLARAALKSQGVHAGLLTPAASPRAPG